MSSSPELQKGKKKEVNKVCVVCGDKAFSFNYGAIACESCKAFFRRNAKRINHLMCTTATRACDITVDSRKSCQRCRAEKCFEAGMKIDLIMSVDEKQKKRELIEKNRQRRRSKVVGSSQCSTPEPSISPVQSSNDVIHRPVPIRQSEHSFTIHQPTTSYDPPHPSISSISLHTVPNPMYTVPYPMQVPSPRELLAEEALRKEQLMQQSLLQEAYLASITAFPAVPTTTQ